MTIDITSITTGEGTTYVRANHFSSGNTPLDTNLAYTRSLFYGTTAVSGNLFNGGMKNNSFFSLGNPIQMGTIRMDITTPLTYTGTQDVRWYYSSSGVSGTYSGTAWKEFTPTLDETNGFTTAGTNLKIKFDPPEGWASTNNAKVTYGGMYILCYVHDAATVTQEPVTSDIKMSVNAIEIIDEPEMNLENLYTTIGDDNILKKISSTSYFTPYNIYLHSNPTGNTKFTIPPDYVLTVGEWTYGKRACVYSVREPDNNFNYTCTFKVGGSEGSASIVEYTPDGHIGRYMYHTIDLENANYIAYGNMSERYFAGDIQVNNSIISRGTMALFQGTGDLTDLTIAKGRFYLYTGDITINSLKMNGNSQIICGWNRIVRASNVDFTNNTSTIYQLSGGAASATFHFINAINLDTDMLAIKYHGSGTDDGDDSHVYQYKTMDLRIIDEQGQPLEGAIISITNSNGDSYGGTTDSDGLIGQQVVYTQDTYNKGPSTTTYLYKNPSLYKQENFYNDITMTITHPDYGTYNLNFVLDKDDGVQWDIKLDSEQSQPTIIYNSKIYNSTIY